MVRIASRKSGRNPGQAATTFASPGQGFSEFGEAIGEGSASKTTSGSYPSTTSSRPTEGSNPSLSATFRNAKGSSSKVGDGGVVGRKVGSSSKVGDGGVVGRKVMLQGRAKRLALARLRRIGRCPRGSATRATVWSMKSAERRREAPALIGWR